MNFLIFWRKKGVKENDRYVYTLPDRLESDRDFYFIDSQNDQEQTAKEIHLWIMDYGTFVPDDISVGCFRIWQT